MVRVKSRARTGAAQAVPPSGAEARRLAILEAARRVVASGGLDSLTHRSVAAEAGVPLGSTTYYFASREELVSEAFGHHIRLVYAKLERLAQDLPLESAADVVDFLVEFFRRALLDPAIVPVEYELIVAAGRDPSLAAQMNAYEHIQSSMLGETLERLGAAQAFEAARILISIVRGFELERLTRPAAAAAELRRRLQRVVPALVAPGTSRSDVGLQPRRRSRTM